MSITIHHADALTQLRQMPSESVQCVITDPIWPNVPAGMFGDVDPWQTLRAVVDALPGGVRRLVIVLRSDSDPRFLSAVPSHWPFFHAAWMQYVKPGMYGRKLGGNEIAYCFGSPIQSAKGRHLVPGMCQVKAQPVAKSAHPCPRAIEHMLWLVNWWSDPGETILDPFAGSGTTGIAAQRLGRDWIGIEKEAAYCTLARQRITDEAPLFAAVASS